MSNETQQIKTKINKIESKIANMQSSLHDIVESIKDLKSNSNPNYACTYTTVPVLDTKQSNKVYITKLENMFRTEPFDKFYDFLKEHAEWMDENDKLIGTDEDEWDKSCYDESKQPFARVVGVLLYFDPVKIAREIVAINEYINKGNKLIDNEDASRNLITSAGLEDCYSVDCWVDEIKRQVETLIRDYFLKDGEANEDEPMKHWQVGRMHLISSRAEYVLEEDEDEKEVCNVLRLFWTNDMEEAGDVY